MCRGTLLPKLLYTSWRCSLERNKLNLRKSFTEKLCFPFHKINIASKKVSFLIYLRTISLFYRLYSFEYGCLIGDLERTLNIDVVAYFRHYILLSFNWMSGWRRRRCVNIEIRNNISYVCLTLGYESPVLKIILCRGGWYGGKLFVQKVLDLSLGQGTVYSDDFCLHSDSSSNSGLVTVNVARLQLIYYIKNKPRGL
jgi:hypothetical protein